MARQIEHDARNHGSEAVIALSFTRAAAAEIASRDVPLPKDNVGTLHSFAYRSIDSPPIAEVGKDLAAFNEQHREFAVTRSSSREEFADRLAEGAGLQTPGDDLLAEYSRLRNLMVPTSALPASVKRFAEAWESYKRETGSVDFTDMLTLALAETEAAPRRPEVIIADEAQDLSRLQLSLLWRWAKSAQKVIMGLDPDQSIYSWAGVDPRVWVEVKPRAQKVLKQSYRVPAAVHALATQWIARLDDREQHDYLPRLEEDGSVAPGVVRRAPYTWDEPNRLVKEIADLADAGRSVMVMAACSYMLEPLVKALRSAAIPFANPWRRARLDWNPLGRQGENSTLGALAAFLAPRREGAERALWTALELAAWIAATKGIALKGCKRDLMRLPEEATEEDVLHALSVFLKPGELDRLFLAGWPGSLDWFHEHLASRRKRPADYALRLVRERGIEIIDQAPRIFVGTIHSFKGGEADAVFCYPDLSRRGFESMLRDPGPVTRQFYVAFTRAREELVLCEAQGPLRVAWPKP